MEVEMEVETFSTQIPLFFSSRQDEFFVLRCEFLSEFFILVTFSKKYSHFYFWRENIFYFIFIYFYLFLFIFIYFRKF
jgi:hypothetical protein